MPARSVQLRRSFVDARFGHHGKRGYLRGKVYRYASHNHLVLPVLLPFECETQARRDEPLRAVAVAVDPAVSDRIAIGKTMASSNSGKERP